MLELYWGVGRDGAVSYLSETFVNGFIFHIMLSFLSKNDHKVIFHWPIIIASKHWLLI